MRRERVADVVDGYGAVEAVSLDEGGDLQGSARSIAAFGARGRAPLDEEVGGREADEGDLRVRGLLVLEIGDPRGESRPLIMREKCEAGTVAQHDCLAWLCFLFQYIQQPIRDHRLTRIEVIVHVEIKMLAQVLALPDREVEISSRLIFTGLDIGRGAQDLHLLPQNSLKPKLPRLFRVGAREKGILSKGTDLNLAACSEAVFQGNGRVETFEPDGVVDLDKNTHVRHARRDGLGDQPVSESYLYQRTMMQISTLRTTFWKGE